MNDMSESTNKDACCSLDAAIEEAWDMQAWSTCIRLCRERLRCCSSDDAAYKIRRKLAYSLLENGGARDCEEAISIFQELLANVSRGSRKSTWLHAHLALAYDERSYGDRAANLQMVVEHNERALAGEAHRQDPAFWASVRAQIGHALVELQSEPREDNLRRAVAYFRAALAVFTEEEFPEEWEETKNAVCRAERLLD